MLAGVEDGFARQRARREGEVHAAHGQAEVLRETAASPATSMPYTMTPATALRVLIVEDSPINQKLLLGLLEGRNCQLTLANNGQEAVSKLESAQFDVVLMDVQMPVMDGLTATRLIRRREAGTARHTPIVAVTAGVERRRCLEAGMDAYLGKPVRPQRLYEQLEELRQ